MTARTKEDDAAHWFNELQSSDTEAQCFIEWQRWLNADPSNREAYEEIERTMLLLKIPVMPPLPSLKDMAADDYDGSTSIAEWKGYTQSMHQRSLVWHAVAAGIASLSLLIGGFWLQGNYRAKHGTFAYHTAAGERRAIELAEGSHITLDADSKLNVQLTPESRTLQLAMGEAYFNVAKDPLRPFTVRVGNMQIRAVGTAFNVRMLDDRTVVAVTEGKVEVTSGTNVRSGTDDSNNPATTHGSQQHAEKQLISARVSAGQAVSYVTNAGLHELPVAEVSLATTWLHGRRQYLNEPLRYVLADINRYSGKRIEVADTATGNLEFTGTLDLDKSEGWLKGLIVALPVNVISYEDGRIAVTAR